MDKDNFYELNPKNLAKLYSQKVNYTVNYTFNPSNPKRVVIDNLVNSLHDMQLDYINEAVDKSDLKEANDLIKHIMEKK